MTDWSDTPPTVPGWYWLKSRLRGEPFLSQLTTGGVWQTGSARATSSYMARHYQFGSRIPTNEELLAMRQQIAELKATCSAYETDEHGIRHTLGAALGYPQDEHGEACVGNTTAARLAEEAARKIATLTAERDAAEAELEAATQRLIDQEVA